MVKVDRRKDNATAEAIAAALRREAEYGFEVAPREAAGTPVSPELVQRILEIGVDRRAAASGEQPDPESTEAGSTEAESAEAESREAESTKAGSNQQAGNEPLVK